MCITGKKLHLTDPIVVLREEIKPNLSYSVKFFNFSMQYRLFSPIVACKERHNLCMNRASLDRASLDRCEITQPENLDIIKVLIILCLLLSFV